MYRVIWRDPSEGYTSKRFMDRADAEAFADRLAAHGMESDICQVMPCACPECDL